MHIYSMNWEFGLHGCRFYYLTDVIGMIGSVYSLVFLSVGRSVLVASKKKYFLKYLENVRYVAIAMALVWIAGVLFSMPGLLSIKLHKSIDGSYMCSSSWSEKKANNFLLIKFFFIFVIPIFIITVSSVKILIFLRDSRRLLNLGQTSTVIRYSHSNNNIPNGQETVKILKLRKNNVQKKATKIVFLIVILFLIQWTPIWTIEMFSFKHSHYIQMFNIMTTVLSHSNSISNPLIYIIFSHKFPILNYLRKCFKRLHRPIIL